MVGNVIDREWYVWLLMDEYRLQNGRAAVNRFSVRLMCVHYRRKTFFHPGTSPFLEVSKVVHNG